MAEVVVVVDPTRWPRLDPAALGLAAGLTQGDHDPVAPAANLRQARHRPAGGAGAAGAVAGGRGARPPIESGGPTANTARPCPGSRTSGDFGDGQLGLDRSSRALFAEIHSELGPVSLLASTRLEKSEGLDAEFTPRASVVIGLAPGVLSLRGAGGRSRPRICSSSSSTTRSSSPTPISWPKRVPVGKSA